MDSILDTANSIARGLAALPAAWLPRRRWQALPGLPIASLAPLSGLLTFAAGVVAAGFGFMHYAWRAAGGAVDATIRIAERQVRHEIPGEVTTVTMQGVSALSMVAFVFFTPLGLFCLYLVVTGLVRAVAAWVEDPIGDPILTGLDALMSRRLERTRRDRSRRARERQEGAAVPDRLLPAAAAGLANFDYVVVASRQKRDWTAGTFVITSDAWYSLGEPFEVRLPEGLRTVYPLKELKDGSVLRRGVAYELPPLEPGRLLRITRPPGR